jgi:hypothetical protein
MKNKIKIDKGIPIPISTRERRYQFEKMEIGDSFFVNKESSASIISSFKQQKQRSSKLKNLKIVTRTLIESGQKGIRVWLTK